MLQQGLHDIHIQKKKQYEEVSIIKMRRKEQGMRPFDNIFPINLDLKLRGRNFLDNYSTVKLDNTLDVFPITGIPGAVV